MSEQSNTIVSKKKFNAKLVKERNGTDDKLTKVWLNYCEEKCIQEIENCIEIIENLRVDYDKYHERAALKNAIRYLEMYLHS